jgi:hypothetical protein
MNNREHDLEEQLRAQLRARLLILDRLTAQIREIPLTNNQLHDAGLATTVPTRAEISTAERRRRSQNGSARRRRRNSHRKKKSHKSRRA